ncbi:TrbC/VirB2 family protein [Rickettsia endosymbiont of Polydrusus tereticollis]|uniref:TrbC/VirB2 family protein n=1 Tax=Rickettsia endosymbiont of Polydrusus tereticollis TaxID=3066251 RepID=UPI0031331304
MNFKKLNIEPLDQNLGVRLLLTFLSIAAIMTSFDTFASGASADPVGAALCNMIKIFRGNTARGIAVVGIIVLGIQTLRGKLQWEVALVIIAAIIILFKAPDIVNMVAGGTADTTCGVTSIA